MDFLDPKQRHAHNVRLVIGYVLIAIALALATTVLFYQANGFGVKEGKVIQNGLVFVSSNPGDAAIYLNGQRYKDNSNTRMVLQAGTYTMKLSRDGYRDWQRALTVEGGSVEHFDYPFLVPQNLLPAKVADYNSAPPLVLQSPDRRWMMNQLPGTPASFDVYDLKDPKKVTSLKTTMTVPSGIFGLPQEGVQSLTLVEWSNDNDHVLLQHKVGDQSEYILVSRKAPETSANLTRQLQLAPTDTLTLQDKKFDHYFMLDTASGVLSTLSLDEIQPVQLLTGVIEYKTYGSDMVLYATTSGVNGDKAAIRLLQDGKTYPIRQVAKNPTYILELSSYGGHWLIAAGAPSESHVYVYSDPVEMLQKDAAQALVPVSVLKVTSPNYVAFSDNTQFVMVENGQDFAVYDAENERTHTYHMDKPLDAPQTHATWMDGFRLRLVSAGQTVIFDYDGTNMQTLEPTQPAYLPFFDTSYQTLYTINPPKAANAPAGQVNFIATSMHTLKDQ